MKSSDTAKPFFFTPIKESISEDIQYKPTLRLLFIEAHILLSCERAPWPWLTALKRMRDVDEHREMQGVTDRLSPTWEGSTNGRRLFSPIPFHYFSFSRKLLSPSHSRNPGPIRPGCVNARISRPFHFIVVHSPSL